MAFDRALQADQGFELARFIRHHVFQETIVDFRAGPPQDEEQNANPCAALLDSQ
jgi:hypothetical protein